MKFSRIVRIRPSKAWIIFGVAMAIGLLAAIAASSYLKKRISDLELKASRENVSVVVAKADLPKGTRLSTSNVAIRQIPGDYSHSSAILPQQFDRIEGQALAHGVKAGEIIFWGLMETRKAPTFSARIESGRRAVTVPVDEINSMSGLLEPGDLIDLVVTIENRGRKATFPLMSGVQVMATGQRSSDDPKSGEKRLYSTVTLDTTPDQARNIVVARDAGRLTALLRNPEDRSVAGGRELDLASVLGLRPGSVRESDEVPFQEVPVLYGGRGGKIPSEGLTLGQYVVRRTPGNSTTRMSSGTDAAVPAQDVDRSPAPPPPVVVQVPVLSGGSAFSAVSPAANSPLSVPAR